MRHPSIRKPLNIAANGPGRIVMVHAHRRNLFFQKNKQAYNRFVEIFVSDCPVRRNKGFYLKNTGFTLFNQSPDFDTGLLHI